MSDLGEDLRVQQLSSDLLSQSVHEKNALIGRIVRGNGMQICNLCYSLCLFNNGILS